MTTTERKEEKKFRRPARGRRQTCRALKIFRSWGSRSTAEVKSVYRADGRSKQLP